MKRIYFVFFCVTLFISSGLWAQEQRGVSFGVRILAGGLGTIFHYGPDYNSSQENRGDSFFSVGPLVSGFAGLKFAETNFTAGVKGFFSPLFTANQSTGVVAGGGVELNYNFE